MRTTKILIWTANGPRTISSETVSERRGRKFRRDAEVWSIPDEAHTEFHIKADLLRTVLGMNYDNSLLKMKQYKRTIEACDLV